MANAELELPIAESVQVADPTVVRIDVRQRNYWPKNGVPTGLGDRNRSFVKLSGNFDRTTVFEILREEAALFGRWFRNTDSRSADEIARTSRLRPIAGGLLDPTTAGAVAALNWFGCPTFWSCNGHEHGQSIPNVAFWAWRRQVNALIACASDVGVGLIESDDGLEVFSSSRAGLHNFGVTIANYAAFSQQGR